MIWTGEQNALCLKMWHEGKTAVAIAGAVGKSAKAVDHHIHLLRKSGFNLPRRKPGRPGRKWQPADYGQPEDFA